MNEKNWYSSHIKPRWNVPTKNWVSWKVQDAFNGGLPDTDNCFEGIVSKIELKYLDKWPARPDTEVWFSFLDKTHGAKGIVSGSQFNHLEAWYKAGGNAFVLIGVGRDWLLLEQGVYINRPMTKEALIASASLVYVDLPKPSYESLADIPPYLIEFHGQQRR